MKSDLVEYELVSVQLKMFDIGVLIGTLIMHDSTTAKMLQKKNNVTLEICKMKCVLTIPQKRRKQIWKPDVKIIFYYLLLTKNTLLDQNINKSFLIGKYNSSW